MIVTRPIAAAEWRRYRELRLAALRDSPDAFGSTYEAEAARPDEPWISRLEAAATSGMDRPLFAMAEGQACGLAWCKVSATEPGVADLFQMWVHPGFRGRGAGAALLDEAIAWARHAGVRRLRLGVTVADSPALRLYRTRGFRPVGGPEPLREGSPLEAQSMELALDEPPTGRIEPTLRAAEAGDAVTVSALAIQVFLDTYATEGVRPDLAREAFEVYSEGAFAGRLRDPSRLFILSERGTGLAGFAELVVASQPAPAGSVTGAELVRLYVQPAFQRRGLGDALLQAAERAASGRGLDVVWLTAWEGNHRARHFYAARGYEDVGETGYTIQGHTYANRVFARDLRSGP